mmetsp:Transcript_7566/g.11135  ORF Transcript_7566/g.11135 Transcript_7566/m.11135 type:complete len:511 (+) Transcript_7566:55-1587(+)|eukprot:CAMPEP_0196801274 /NCGR_PEP_ID=MMETSP1362-20130617/1040_1 /TAXON_ID=163516 /ORGANISM="Leptocylindrus danicus, Strain CCMP1856" /LENGTH=510 /DNA_ID=CAMNT_0042172153 /DNA_START=55 /DNA_END=1587 /DNA_ORIENTATION=+
MVKTSLLLLTTLLTLIECSTLRGTSEVLSNNSDEVNRDLQTASYVNVVGSCNYSNVLAGYKAVYGNTASSVLASQLGVAAGTEESAVASACAGAAGPSGSVPFNMLANEGIQFDQNYMNGNSDWNLDHSDGATRYGRVKRVYDNGMHYPVEWPEYMTQFKSCDTRAAMCCYVSTRSGANPARNTDVCVVDFYRAMYSNHVGVGRNGGFSVYNAKASDAVNCQGFAWSSDEEDFSAKYKGNSLFYTSMYNGLHEQGMTKNVPGAPMCGCVESMPIVTTADCTEAVEGYRFHYYSNKLTVAFDVQFVPCTDSSGVEVGLSAYYDKLVTDGKATTEDKAKLGKTIVGTCDAGTNSVFVKKGRPWWYIDSQKWTTFAGKGIFAETPEIGEEQFMTLFNASTNKIVRRVCRSCWESHREIYYKRITPVPSTLDLYDTFLNNWFSTDNVLNEDFELYSTYEDALSGDNKWTYCNYDDENVGFPRDCGPTGYIPSNWSTFGPPEERGTRDVIFMVEK